MNTRRQLFSSLLGGLALTTLWATDAEARPGRRRRRRRRVRARRRRGRRRRRVRARRMAGRDVLEVPTQVAEGWELETDAGLALVRQTGLSESGDRTREVIEVEFESGERSMYPVYRHDTQSNAIEL